MPSTSFSLVRFSKRNAPKPMLPTETPNSDHHVHSNKVGPSSSRITFKKPVIVHDYPKGIKAFYMRLSDDMKTVASMDVLVPKVGFSKPIS